MAGARIYLGLDAGAAATALAGLGRQLDDNGRALMLGRIGEYLLGSTRERAAEQVSPAGVPWAALSPRYAKYKEKKRPGVPKLKFDFHMLGDQLSQQVDGDTLLVGTSAPYGAIHQFGGRVTVHDAETGQAFQAEMPARPWLGISDKDQVAIAERVIALLQRGLGAGGSTG